MADTVRCYAATSLAPGSFAMRQPERGQTTHPHSEVAYVSVGARHPPDGPRNRPSTLQLRKAEPIPHA
jgi:hypothetical protein